MTVIAPKGLPARADRSRVGASCSSAADQRCPKRSRKATVGHGYDSTHDRRDPAYRADRRLAVADDLTFSDIVDFLADHEGQKIYVEIGTRDRESTEQPADAFILKLHGHRLGKVQDATDHNPGGERKAPMIYLEPIDADRPSEDDNRVGTRLFINPRQVTKVQGDPQRGLKVWLDDEAVYIGIIPS